VTDIASRLRSPRTRWAALALGAVALVLLGWLGVSALSARSNLEQARTSAQAVKEALLNGDATGATQSAEAAVVQAQAARSATRALPWSLAAAVPLLGSPFKSGQQIADVVAGLASDVLLPAAEQGVDLAPDSLYVDGRVDVGRLRAEEPQLAALATAATGLDTRAAAITEPAFFGPIRDARTQLQGQTAEVAQLLSNTALAGRLAPSMMGADGPRAYLMAFQTPAEARGTGGLLGGFGILRFVDGKATVDDLASNRDFIGLSAKVDLGQQFNDTYGYTNPFTDFRNTNLSSHFPYAAQIWKSMWESDTGERVDGVIALDPIALSYILKATGPVTVRGETITADNVVELTLSTAYERYPDDQEARKEFLQDIAKEAVKATTGPVKSPRNLLDALGRAAGERRLAVWSAIPADQELLETTSLAHAIPGDTAPYAAVIINNLAGNKMDYYLKREIEYAADGCDGDRRKSTVTVRLTNTARPGQFTEYVGGRGGIVEGLDLNVPLGTMVTSVRLLATQGSKLEGIVSNGQRLAANVDVERGHPSYEVQVVIPPGQSGEISFQLSEPTVPGAARVPVQPLTDNLTPEVSVPTCQG
jgi:hypothetical protein